MIDNDPNEAPEMVDAAFLVTASELRDRREKKRREQELPHIFEAIRKLVEIGLKAALGK
jgi:hypothetical protein